MGIFEGIMHSEEVEELLNNAQKQYDNAKNELEDYAQEIILLKKFYLRTCIFCSMDVYYSY